MCGMNAWWVGTVSTVIGGLTGALLQAWRERTTYKRQMAVRWDQTLLTGLADYMATADRALRALLRWRHRQLEDDASEIADAATAAFESLHEKSHLIALLTGDRDDPVRVEARKMRETLLPLCGEVQGRNNLDEQQVQDLIKAHRVARNSLIQFVQKQFRRNA